MTPMSELSVGDGEQLRMVAREEAQHMERDEQPRFLHHVVPEIAARMSTDDVLTWLTMAHSFVRGPLKPREPMIFTNAKL